MLTLVFLASVVPASAFLSGVRRRCVWKKECNMHSSREGEDGKTQTRPEIYASCCIKKNIKERVRNFQDLKVILWCPLCCNRSSSHTTLRKAILFHWHFRIEMETGQNKGW